MVLRPIGAKRHFIQSSIQWVQVMSNQQLVKGGTQADVNGALLLGTGLAFASLILVPALAAQWGIGPSLTGALRMALMKASNRAVAKISRGG